MHQLRMTPPVTRSSETRHDPSASAGAPEDGTNSLLDQAAAFARVAREAHQQCEQGRNAEKQLLARRNRSGQ